MTIQLKESEAKYVLGCIRRSQVYLEEAWLVDNINRVDYKHFLQQGINLKNHISEYRIISTTDFLFFSGLKKRVDE